MLDFLRRSATSVFAWLILGALALAFGLSFGLPSDSISFGAEKYVKVHGEAIGDEDFRYQINLASRWGLIPKDAETQESMGAREEALEAIVERLIFAHYADELGLATTERQAEDLILDGHVILFGFTLDFLGGERDFNYEWFKRNWLPSLGVAEQRYMEYQEQEFLARAVRDLIRAGAAVPEPVLRAEYDANANQISIRYARYEAAAFGESYDPTDAEVTEYIDKHRSDLSAEFTTQGSRFTKLGKQMRVWVIEVPKGDDAGSDDGADAGDEGGDADAGADGGDSGAEPAAPSGARADVDAARAKLTGGEDFRAVARAMSKHDSAARGGDLGWIGESLGTGLDPVVDEAARAVEIDTVSEVLEGESSYFLVRVTGRREGDVPEAEAFLDLAVEAIKRDKGRELAKAAAEADKAAVLVEGKAVTEVFAAADALDAPIEDFPLDGTDGQAPRRKVAMNETGPTPKGQPLRGIGAPVPKLVEQAWASESEDALLDDVFEVGNDYLLAGVVSKVSGSDEEYKEQRALVYEQASRAKAGAVTAYLAERLCLEAKAKGDLVVSEDKVKRLVTYDTAPETKEEGQPEKKPYEVCERVGNRGGFLTTRLRMLEAR